MQSRRTARRCGYIPPASEQRQDPPRGACVLRPHRPPGTSRVPLHPRNCNPRHDAFAQINAQHSDT